MTPPKLLDANTVLLHELDLRPGMVYADLGIGTSAHFIFSAARIVGDDGKVFAVDILQPVLETVKGRAKSDGYHNVETVWTDLEVYGAAKTIANDSVERMSLVNLLYQTKEDAHVINEANRMLQPGGKVLVIDWNPKSGNFGPPEETRTSLDKVRQMAKVVGWKEVRTFTPSDYHFGVLFEKA
jgi:ubiquinone/menaquinone biosynthesis C-methylase UbiE